MKLYGFECNVIHGRRVEENEITITQQDVGYGEPKITISLPEAKILADEIIRIIKSTEDAIFEEE